MVPKVQEYMYYSYYGFGYLQNWAANTILRHTTKKDKAEIVAMTVPMKIPPMYKDPFAFLLDLVAPYVFMLIYVPLIYRTTFRLVMEKEKRIRETMRIMGMADTPYWLSWFFYHSIISLIISISIMLVAGFTIFSFASLAVIWLLFFLYGQAIFGIIVTMQSMFSQAKTAAIMTVLFYLGTSVLASSDQEKSFITHTLLSLFPTYCMATTLKTILGFEQNRIGIKMDASLTQDYKNFTVLTGLIMMFISFIFWLLLGLYLEQVLPKQFGKKQPTCFCLQHIPCCRKVHKYFDEMPERMRADSIVVNVGSPVVVQAHLRRERNFSVNSSYSQVNEEFETKYLKRDAYEGVTPEVAQMEAGEKYMRISDLKKQYDNGFLAVKGINLKLYSDQIFVLLGHNGAGKTSTISLMTGLYEPTEGEIEIFGLDMQTQLEEVRKCMGVCPQHDVLFDLLTPQEHMEIFYDFKCEDRDPVKKAKEIKKLLEDLGVADKRNDLAGQLSGGNQRKLSVGIALCGGSKLVVFDEPTAGMDLSARRQTWNALREYKKDRIILLTTHYMDEADILGDRIGIMAAGQLVCLGSSMFLKRKYGVGYNMTMLKASKEANALIMPYFHEKLGENCKKMSEIQSEFTIQIPKEYSNNFKAFFAQFDHDLDFLKILAYGVSITTLEDVFMKVGMLDDDSLDPTEEKNDNVVELDFERDNRRSLGDNLEPLERWSHLSSFSKRHSRKWSFRESTRAAKANFQQNQKKQGTGPGMTYTVEHLAPPLSQSSKNPMTDLGASDKFIGQAPDKYIDQEELNQFLPQYYDDKEGGEDDDDETNYDKSGSHLKMHDQVAVQSSARTTARTEDSVFSLSQSSTDDGFCNSFRAVTKKRYQQYANSKLYMFVDILLPVMFMVLGIWGTTVGNFKRTKSQILSPERFDYKNQQILFDKTVTMQDETKVEELIDLMPGMDDYFTRQYTTKAGGQFDQFGEISYAYGTEKVNKMPYFYSGYQIYEANYREKQYKFYNFVNMTNQDAAALYPQFMYEAIIKHATKYKSLPVEFKVRTTPFPITEAVRERKAGTNAATLSFVTAVAFAMMLSNIAGLVVEERVARVKHIQVISGMRLDSYWAANFVIDLAKMEICSLCSVGMFYAMGTVFQEACISYLLFPFAAIPMTYCLAFLFPSVSSAQTFTIFSNFLVILILPALVLFMRNFEPLFDIGETLNYASKLCPGFCVTSGVFFNSLHHKMVDIRSVHKGYELSGSAWHSKNILGDVIGLCVNFLFWSFMLMWIEKSNGKMGSLRGMPAPRTDIEYDEDVKEEEDRVISNPDKHFQIKVTNLRKVYMRSSGPLNPGKPLCAVENLTFGLSKGECFGLLGVNGAGKSTTFKMLTAEEAPTSGSIKIQGMDMNKEFQKCRKLIGYCPQYNAIFETLSVEQNIEYFATIKGIPEKHRKTLIEDVIEKLGLQIHRDKATGTLSGGNKRKVCVAIAILGNPPIILLDEPSAGMDPEARRFMWEVIGQIASDMHSAVILTSHLMEEAEALSTKMGIMVKGGIFKCFGSSQHIKNKFGVGFEVEVKIKVPRQKELKAMAQQEFGSNLGLAGFLIENGQKLYVGTVLNNLIYERNTATLVADQVRKELVTHFMQAASINNISSLQDPSYDYSRFTPDSQARDITCSAHIFMEKLLISRQQHGIIASLCRAFGSLELLEQYGNYMRLRVSSQEKTIGQMFGMIEDLKGAFDIDQYAISQTTLEQIFQSFANLNFDSEVKTFSIDEKSGSLRVRALKED